MVFMEFMTSNEPTCVPPTRYLGPRSPKIGPRKGQNPQVLAYFGLFGPKGLRKIFGLRGEKNQKKIFLLQITFKGPPEGLAPSKTPNSRSGPPGPPRLGPFCGQNGPNRGQKTRFFKKYFLIHITPGRSPEGLVPSKTQN